MQINIKGVAQAEGILKVVRSNGLEPSTPTMSRWCSNQLSYVPSMGAHSKWMKKRVKQFFQLTH